MHYMKKDIEEVIFSEIHPSLKEIEGGKFILYWSRNAKNDIIDIFSKSYKMLLHLYKILVFLSDRRIKYDPDIYGKENEGKPNIVVAMKFKGDSQITHNLRIYCQEHEILGQFHIVMDKVHKGKRTKKNSKKENDIIRSVAKKSYKLIIQEIILSKRPRRKQ